MVNLCSVYGCGKSAELYVRVLHAFPLMRRHGSVKIAKAWQRFVGRTRHWHGPTKNSRICSDHFEEHCYENWIAWKMKACKQLVLKVDQVPTKYPKGTCRTKASPATCAKNITIENRNTKFEEVPKLGRSAFRKRELLRIISSHNESIERDLAKIQSSSTVDVDSNVYQGRVVCEPLPIQCSSKINRNQSSSTNDADKKVYPVKVVCAPHSSAVDADCNLSNSKNEDNNMHPIKVVCAPERLQSISTVNMDINESGEKVGCQPHPIHHSSICDAASKVHQIKVVCAPHPKQCNSTDNMDINESAEKVGCQPNPIHCSSAVDAESNVYPIKVVYAPNSRQCNPTVEADSNVYPIKSVCAPHPNQCNSTDNMDINESVEKVGCQPHPIHCSSAVDAESNVYPIKVVCAPNSRQCHPTVNADSNAYPVKVECELQPLQASSTHDSDTGMSISQIENPLEPFVGDSDIRTLSTQIENPLKPIVGDSDTGMSISHIENPSKPIVGDSDTSTLSTQIENPSKPIVGDSDTGMSPSQIGGRVREEKQVLFKSFLWELFTCPKCMKPCPVEENHRSGTSIVVTQACRDCNFKRDWSSQPHIIAKHVVHTSSAYIQTSQPNTS